MPFHGLTLQWSRPVSTRWILSLILIATAPAAAAAQFTTFITPPNPAKDSLKAAVVAEQKAITDSVNKAQIANLKTWVDSAAGVVVPPVDTAIQAESIVTDSLTTTASNGLLAPNTASPVPLLLLTGILGLLLGIAMVRRPQEKPRRIDDDR
jgi:hypothetical protein